LGYPDHEDVLAEHIARDAFITTHDDPEFQLKVQENEPKNLKSAERCALRFEIFKNQVEAATNTR